MRVKLIWPDGRTEVIEHQHAKTAVVIEVADKTPRPLDPDVVTSVDTSPVHKFRRILVGNVDTGSIRTLWVHTDTPVEIVKMVVDHAIGEGSP